MKKQQKQIALLIGLIVILTGLSVTNYSQLQGFLGGAQDPGFSEENTQGSGDFGGKTGSIQSSGDDLVDKFGDGNLGTQTDENEGIIIKEGPNSSGGFVSGTVTTETDPTFAATSTGYIGFIAQAEDSEIIDNLRLDSTNPASGNIRIYNAISGAEITEDTSLDLATSGKYIIKLDNPEMSFYGITVIADGYVSDNEDARITAGVVESRDNIEYAEMELQYARIVRVVDEEGYDLEGATVTVDTNTNCQELDYDLGHYACAESIDSDLSYEISKDAHTTLEGTFTSERDEHSDGQKQSGLLGDIILEYSSDPASFCTGITISSSDLPLASDADSNQSIEVLVEVSASNSLFSDTIEIYVQTGNGIIYDTSNTAYENGAGVHETPDGTYSSYTYSYSNWADGESIAVVAENSNCESSLDITQDEEEVEDTDRDDDGLSNEEEGQYGTDADNPDTDGDGDTDYDEIINGTDPLDPSSNSGGTVDPVTTVVVDTDGDGIPDDYENASTCLDSAVADGSGDPDNDNYSSLVEYSNGFDPCENASDTDEDGMPNDWETLYSCLNENSDDASSDADGDGLSNYDEYINGSHPCDADSDNDGLDDEYEINTSSTDPNDSDSDDDGLSDWEEINTYNTNPNDSDSDNDGDNDGTEVSNGTDPNDSTDYADVYDDIDYTVLDDENISYTYCFNDMVGRELESTVCRLYAGGFVNGPEHSPGNFEPSEYFTYGQLAKLLTLMRGDEVNGPTDSFFATTHWASRYASALEDANVFRLHDGFPNNLDLPITRADAMVYIARAINGSADGTCDFFQDCPNYEYFSYAANILHNTEFDHPERGSIRVLQGVEVASGSTYLYPYNYMAREEAMSLLLNSYLAYFSPEANPTYYYQ
jgi:hypothetical protein